MNIEIPRKEKSQHGKVLYLNHSSFWIFIQNITFQQFKNSFYFATCLNPWKNYGAGKGHEMFVSQHNMFDCKLTRDYSKICKVLSEKVHSQYFSSCKFFSMEGVALEQ